MADSTIPLCNWAQFTEGAFADLARNYTTPAVQSDLLMEATRLCEGAAGGRRLAPFVGLVETHRLSGVDPDEYADSANLPLDLVGTVGRSYAYALNSSTLVRHFWLNQYASRHPELWSYADLSMTVTRSYGGITGITSSQYVGPEIDSGHVWFTLGQFIPIGSLARVTYSGGYTTTPADLVRAGKLMTASLIIRELAPSAQSRDPHLLADEAERICARYGGDLEVGRGKTGG